MQFANWFTFALLHIQIRDNEEKDAFNDICSWANIIKEGYKGWWLNFSMIITEVIMIQGMHQRGLNCTDKTDHYCNDHTKFLLDQMIYWWYLQHTSLLILVMAICNKCELVSTLIFNIVKSADNFMKIIGGAAQEIAVKNIKK